MLKRLIGLVIFTLIISPLSYAELKAQAEENVELKSPEKVKILILPAKIGKFGEHSIEEEITGYIADIATNLGRFEVIDRNNIESIVKEQKLQLSGLINESMITEIGNISAAQDGILVTISHFSQKGVPKKDNDNDDSDEDDDHSIIGSIFGGIVRAIVSHEDHGKEQYPNNIQTSLTVNINKIDIETGITQQSVTISVSHTGGNRGKSKNKTINKFKRRAVIEMKNFYLLTAGVEVLPDGRIFIPAGYEIGVKKGTLFEIISETKNLNVRGKTYTFEGERVAFVEASELLDEGNLAKPIKVWKPIKSGYKAIEFHRPIIASAFYFTQFNTGTWALNIVPEFLPFNRMSGRLGIRFIRGKDSRDEVDNGIGVDIGPSLKIINKRLFSVRIFGGFGGLFFFKRDDAGALVNSASVSSILGLNIDYFKSGGRDLSFELGYRFDSGSSSWNNLGEEDEPDYEAVWIGNTPEIDISGFYISVGYKFTSLKNYF
ncbi:MAG: hypothetical protein IIB39_08400 [Candidatus Marinimicrobia bacterium]|nr:hypothetical protein [Candidatus Neomarinimicrobiota bacterium]